MIIKVRIKMFITMENKMKMTLEEYIYIPSISLLYFCVHVIFFLNLIKRTITKIIILTKIKWTKLSFQIGSIK